jgi:hypothetical protein
MQIKHYNKSRRIMPMKFIILSMKSKIIEKRTYDVSSSLMAVEVTKHRLVWVMAHCRQRQLA